MNSSAFGSSSEDGPMVIESGTSSVREDGSAVRTMVYENEIADVAEGFVLQPTTAMGTG